VDYCPKCGPPETWGPTPEELLTYREKTPSEECEHESAAELKTQRDDLLALLSEIASETIPGKANRTAYEQRLADIIISAEVAIKRVKRAEKANV